MEWQTFFEIPDCSKTMSQLIEAMPSNWGWVDGTLYAPKELIVSGQVAQDTGFAMQRFHSIKPTIIGGWDSAKGGAERKKPDLFALVVEGKLPGFVSFEEAGYGDTTVSLALAKRIAAGMIGKGYRGALYFYKDCRNNHKFDNSAACSLELRPWDGTHWGSVEGGKQLPRIRVEWHAFCGGKKEDVASIIAACRSFNLREYTLTEKTSLAAR